MLKAAEKSYREYEYKTLLHNTRDGAVELTLVQLFPRSDSDKIVVELLQVSARALAHAYSPINSHTSIVAYMQPPRDAVPVTGEKGAAVRTVAGNDVDVAAGAPAASSGEGQLQSGAVMQNKLSNNVVFNVSLQPQEKREITFAYSIKWPYDAETGEVEIV
jgi:hypothetical protein